MSRPHLDTLLHHVIPVHPHDEVGQGQQERVHLGVLLLAQSGVQLMDHCTVYPGAGDRFSPGASLARAVGLLPPGQRLLPLRPLPEPLPDDLLVNLGVGLAPGPDEGLQPRLHHVVVAAPVSCRQGVER